MLMLTILALHLGGLDFLSVARIQISGVYNYILESVKNAPTVSSFLNCFQKL
jgi:hypothetical protein